MTTEPTPKVRRKRVRRSPSPPKMLDSSAEAAAFLGVSARLVSAVVNWSLQHAPWQFRHPGAPTVSSGGAGRRLSAKYPATEMFRMWFSGSAAERARVVAGGTPDELVGGTE
jgi:hypothetical protein